MDSSFFEIFTDGSCHTQQRIGAYASLLVRDNMKTYLKGTVKDTTHNRMELLAVIMSIDFMDEQHPGTPMVIYTDSQYVERISERKEKLKKNNFITKKGTPIQNVDMIRCLIHQIETHDVWFVKIKAHQNPEEIPVGERQIVAYNAEVDKIARELVRKQIDSTSKDFI
jgi:ribonuclease HI